MNVGEWEALGVEDVLGEGEGVEEWRAAVGLGVDCALVGVAALRVGGEVGVAAWMGDCVPPPPHWLQPPPAGTRNFDLPHWGWGCQNSRVRVWKVGFQHKGRGMEKWNYWGKHLQGKEWIEMRGMGSCFG